MHRNCLAVCLAALLAAATGCTMCDHPYDYCGPTYTGECGQTCNPLARAGSILSPPAEITTSSPSAASGGQLQPEPAGEAPAADEPAPATESRSPAPNRSGRWTARLAPPPPR